MSDSFDDLSELLDSPSPTPEKAPVRRGRPPKVSEENKNLDQAVEDIRPSSVPASPEGAPVEVEDPEDARLRELTAALANVPVETVAVRPVPYEQLTPKQRQIRDLEDLLAQRETTRLSQSEEVYDTTASNGDAILIHFLVDGFTAAGKVWMTGQEAEFILGSPAYEQTKDRLGFSWLDLVDDEVGQFKRFGKLVFKRGPWRGAKYDDVFAEEDKTRGRAVPIIR